MVNIFGEYIFRHFTTAKFTCISSLIHCSPRKRGVSHNDRDINRKIHLLSPYTRTCIGQYSIAQCNYSITFTQTKYTLGIQLSQYVRFSEKLPYSWENILHWCLSYLEKEKVIKRGGNTQKWYLWSTTNLGRRIKNMNEDQII